MGHEKLECYRQLVSLAEGVARRVAKWPKGNAYLKDQIQRAIGSAILNLSEGNAKRIYRAERRRFFEASVGSIAEVSACLDLALIYGLIEKEDQESLKSRLRLAYTKVRALP